MLIFLRKTAVHKYQLPNQMCDYFSCSGLFSCFLSSAFKWKVSQPCFSRPRSRLKANLEYSKWNTRRLTFDRGSSLYLDGSNHKMSVMGWAGHDERKCSDGRVAEEMALKSCSVVQNKGRLLTKHSNTLMKHRSLQTKHADNNKSNDW